MSQSLRAGIDLGGTKIEGALVDADGRFVERLRTATPAADYAALTAAIVSMVDRLRACAGTPLSVGVGIPGSVSPASGLIRNANTTVLNGRALCADLESALGQPVRLANDANCMLNSEVNGGAAAGADTAFGVIIGTGTGGAVAIGGHVVEGANGIAGEWGHNRVPADFPGVDGRRCYCGRQDCVETYLSGPGLLRSHAVSGGERLTSVEQLAARAAAGNDAARRSLQSYLEQLAVCLSAVVNLLDPDVVVLAGGVSNLARLDGGLAGRLPHLAFSDVLDTRIVRARFGDSSGVRGAACLWP